MFLMTLYVVEHQSKLVHAGICMDQSAASIQEGSEKSGNEFKSMKVDLDSAHYQKAILIADHAVTTGRMSAQWWNAIYDYLDKEKHHEEVSLAN